MRSESLCSDGRTFLKSQGNKSRLSHLLGLVREEEMDDTEAVATIMLGVEAGGGVVPRGLSFCSSSLLGAA